VVLVGLAAAADVPLDVLDLIDSELDVPGSYRYANTYPAAIDLLADGSVDVEGFVDFESPPRRRARGFRAGERSRDGEGMITL